MLSRDLKVGIIGGVISSILVIIFIQPILSFVWGTVLSFGEAIQADYVDRIYRNAAAGDRDMVGRVSLLTLIVLLSFVSMLFLTERREIHSEIPKWVSSTIIFVPSTMALFLAGTVMILFSLSSGVVEINASFSQRLVVMAPAISDQEHKEWRARWAKMRSQSDYRALVAAMEKRASDLKIQLPELRSP